MENIDHSVKPSQLHVLTVLTSEGLRRIMVLMKVPFRTTTILPLRTLPSSIRSFTTSYTVRSPRRQAASPRIKAEKSKSTQDAVGSPRRRAGPSRVESNAASGKRKEHINFWTPEEAERLFQLRESRLPWAEIEDQFPNRTLTAIKSKCYQNAPRGEKGRLLHTTQYTDAERTLMSRLRAEGVSWPKIQKEHFPDRTVHQLVECHHLTRVKGEDDAWSPKPWDQAESDRLVNLREKRQLDWNEMAVEIGRTQSSLKSKYRKLVAARELDSGKRVYVGVRSKKFFSQEDEEKLAGMLRDGASTESMRQAFPERSPQSLGATIIRLKHKEGLELRPHPATSPVDEKTLKEVVRLKEEGMPWTLVADLLPGFSYNQLLGAYRRALKSGRVVERERKAASVDEKTLQKVMRIKEKDRRVQWKEVADLLPGFEPGQLKYAYFRAKRLQKEANALN